MGKYSEEKNVQILMAVLKANGIRKVVVSPGATNISFVGSLMNDGEFELYSAVDERGAAYIACGLASESGEAVVITCTGATASRNYLPGLTEAYHRKLPILAVTASQDFVRRTNLVPQVIDRSNPPADAVRLHVEVPIVRTESDEYEATLKINKAVLELFRHGGGPVHIDLASAYMNSFPVNDLSHVRIMKRFFPDDSLPEIRKNARVAVIVGNHPKWSASLTEACDRFCAAYNAVVLVDHSSHYWGNYRVLPTIVSCQQQHKSELFNIDLLIHIGEEHGDYYTEPPMHGVKEVWRVSPDGELRDTYGKLTKVFEMREESFFRAYAEKRKGSEEKHEYLDAFKKETKELYNMLPELPFSNIWLAQQVIPRFPSDACLELGVSNTMRAWTFFDFEKETYTLANTGCRGIDGAIPTLLGMSLAEPDRLHFAVMGDLTFFYSFNVLGNHHIGKNLRILLVNNGCGAEFHMYSHRAMKACEQDHGKINQFVAAGGHMGYKSRQLVKHFAEDLGFHYLTASGKKEFLRELPAFLDEKDRSQPMIFEVFTDIKDESDALYSIRNMKVDTQAALKGKLKSFLGR